MNLLRFLEIQPTKFLKQCPNFDVNNQYMLKLIFTYFLVILEHDFGVALGNNLLYLTIKGKEVYKHNKGRTIPAADTVTLLIPGDDPTYPLNTPEPNSLQNTISQTLFTPETSSSPSLHLSRLPFARLLASIALSTAISCQFLTRILVDFA